MAATDQENTCCGKDGTWSPKPGSPVAAACMLCQSSPTYWRNGQSGQHVGEPLRNDVDPFALAERLAAIAADPDWPEDLRTEARAAAGGLDVDDLSDSVIITALNARIVVGANHPPTVARARQRR